MYYAQSGTNRPASGNGFIWVNCVNEQYGSQLYIGFDNSIWYRTLNTGNWGSWHRLAHYSGNVYSGDGRLHKLFRYFSSSVTVPANGSTKVATWTFPSAFSENPTILDGLYTATNAYGITLAAASVSSTGCDVWAYNNSATSRVIIAHLMAIGA